MAKVIRIKTCQDCPFSYLASCMTDLARCRKVRVPKQGVVVLLPGDWRHDNAFYENKEIDVIHWEGIPKWCPLDEDTGADDEIEVGADGDDE